MSSGKDDRRFQWGALPYAGGGLAIALAWPLLSGASLSQLWPLAVSLAVGLCAGFLPQRWLPAALSLGMIAALAIAPSQHLVMLVTGFAYASGLLASATLHANRVLAGRRVPAAVRVGWDDGSARHSQDTPSWPEVDLRLQALDGIAHTMASLHRKDRRLDVCCPDAGRYWVIHTEPGPRRPTVHQAFTGRPDTGGEVSARIGGMDFHYPDHLFVDLLTVLAAARWFWEFDGTRNPSLTWDQDTNRHEVLIPPPVGELD